MKIDNLIKMANQIGSFFEAYADRELARNEITAHLRRFWEPRLREALIAQIEAGQATGLSPFVADAVRRLRH